jgi:hypothetical protein
MIFFDGTYRLQQAKSFKTAPIRQWAYAWRIRIINLSISQPEVAHLKPYLVFATQSGGGVFKSNCAESLGKRICRDFDLNVREILWIEQFNLDHGRMLVATFSPQEHFESHLSYHIAWRSIRPNELGLLKAFIPASELGRDR